jgi:uncharacterized protein
MALAPELLEMLVCVDSKAPLIYFEDEQFLLCAASRLKYRIDDDIPVMLLEEAERLEQSVVDELVADARRRGLANAPR